MASRSASRRNRRFSVDDLFTDTRPQAVGVEELHEARVIDLDRIQPDPEQPRRAFDDDRLDELAASIKAEGVLQPIVVRYDVATDAYIIIHGERRWRASQRAGQASIPALVREVPKERRLLQQLMENIVREDLNAVDRAGALRELKDQMGDAAWDDVADAVGIKRSRLFQLLGTAKLSESAQEDIRSGKLSEKQSRALQGLTLPQQEALRSLMVKSGIPASVGTRISRALRNLPDNENMGNSAAEEAVTALYELIDPPDTKALTRQTQTLLAAIAEGGNSELAQLLGTPKFDGDRVEREIGVLARSLARSRNSDIGENASLRETLQHMRAAIDALLADE